MSAPDRERSAEERERARLEREARRAARARGEKTAGSAPGGGLLAGLRGARAAERRDGPVATPPAPPSPPEPPPPERHRPPAPPPLPEGNGPPAAPPPQHARRTALFRAAAVAAAIAALALAWFLVSLFQPFKGDGEGEVRVQIPTGATVTEIGELLEENEVIASEFFFRARVTLGNHRGDLKPGNYKLARDMSYGAVIDALSSGPPDDIVVVTIPEGKSRGEIAPIVEEAGLSGNYRRASIRSPAIDLRRYRAAGRAESLEGFLFPATYDLNRGASAEDLVRKQLETFETEFAKVDLGPARKKNLTPYDVLIIASMVEREAGVERDRPLIASVIHNRLSAGIPLGIDATIRFALGNWTKPLKESELASPSPYNTRTTAGLPPGPIGNPGLDSIRAAADPPGTDYLYFVVKPCGEGEHAFSETEAEFQRDVERYNAERQRQGGKSPTEC